MQGGNCHQQSHLCDDAVALPHGQEGDALADAGVEVEPLGRRVRLVAVVRPGFS
jgi:hypothetical protein